MIFDCLANGFTSVNKTVENRRKVQYYVIMAPKYDPSLETYLKEYQANPRSRIFAPLAEAYRKSGLVDEAIDICKEGLEYHPNFVSGIVALARCYFDKGQYTASIKELEKVISEVPDNFLAQRMLAESYSLIGDVQNALKSYKMILFLNPRDEEVKKIIAGMESAPSSRPSSETVAEILGEDPRKKDLQEEVILPPPPLSQEPPPMFELKREIVNDLVNDSELGFEERPAYQAFNVIGEEEQEKILTEIGTSTMGELLEKQGHKQKALEVYKNIYNKTLDQGIKEKINALEISLGIKEYSETAKDQEELPKEMYFQSEQSSEKDGEPQILVYNPEPVEEISQEELKEAEEILSNEETHQDEDWMTPIQGAPQDQRLKMLQQLLEGFQQYKKTS